MDRTARTAKVSDATGIGPRLVGMVLKAGDAGAASERLTAKVNRVSQELNVGRVSVREILSADQGAGAPADYRLRTVVTPAQGQTADDIHAAILLALHERSIHENLTVTALPSGWVAVSLTYPASAGRGEVEDVAHRIETASGLTLDAVTIRGGK